MRVRSADATAPARRAKAKRTVSRARAARREDAPRWIIIAFSRSAKRYLSTMPIWKLTVATMMIAMPMSMSSVLIVIVST
jgi:hypothetical protein